MRTVIRILVVALVVAAIGTIMPATADAQSYMGSRPGSRGGTWDFFLSPTYSGSSTIDGQGGAKVDVNEDWGFGFGLGYNFNDNVQLNSFFNWNSRSYNATVVQANGTTLRYNNDLETFTLSLNGVYYILKGDFSPFVSGGIGYTNWDTNIQTGPATGSCWFDPWYGYICSSYVPTKTESDFSYSAGVGIRYDVNRSFGLQAGYYKTWIDIGNASGTPDFDIWRLDFIIRFGM